MKHLTMKLLVTAIISLFGSSAFANHHENAVRVACVGDSITYGAGVKRRGHNNYPAVLGRLLGPSHQVRNFGVNGATMLKNGDKPYWKQGAFKAAKDFKPNIVIIKLGTNDTKPHNWKHKEHYPKDYIEMVKVFQNLESKPQVWVCYPVPVFPKRWGINDKAVREEVIPYADQAAKATGIKTINLYKALEGKPELVPDKVHPNVEGARIIAETVYEAIKP